MFDTNMIDLTKVLIAILDLLALLVTYKLIPWLKAKLTTEQQAQLRAAVKVSVFAAEQLYGAGNGPEKMKFVKQYLMNHGYDVNPIEIEAAVGEYINNALNMLETSKHREDKNTEKDVDLVAE